MGDVETSGPPAGRMSNPTSHNKIFIFPSALFMLLQDGDCEIAMVAVGIVLVVTIMLLHLHLQECSSRVLMIMLLILLAISWLP